MALVIACWLGLAAIICGMGWVASRFPDTRTFAQWLDAQW